MATPKIPTTPRAKYLAAQKAFIAISGLKVGSTVRIINKAYNEQYGWNNHWDDDMNKYVHDGEDYEVVDIETFRGDGVELNNGWQFPFFCLEVLNSDKIRLSDDYSAEINDDGSIEVGCQSIDYDTLKKVYDAATKKKASYKAPVKKHTR